MPVKDVVLEKLEDMTREKAIMFCIEAIYYSHTGLKYIVDNMAKEIGEEEDFNKRKEKTEIRKRLYDIISAIENHRNLSWILNLPETEAKEEPNE